VFEFIALAFEFIALAFEFIALAFEFVARAFELALLPAVLVALPGQPVSPKTAKLNKIINEKNFILAPSTRQN
jgi:hypothetical protein